jgi:hypothetical protein
MTFDVEIFEGDTLDAGVQIALDARLYIPGWCLRGTLLDAIEYHGRKKLALGFLDGEAVCLVIYTGWDVMAFCRRALRGNGYASACLQKMNLDREKCSAAEGIKGSLTFWQKQGIVTYGTSRWN